jgi:hypothetical protein
MAVEPVVSTSQLTDQSDPGYLVNNLDSMLDTIPQPGDTAILNRTTGKEYAYSVLMVIASTESTIGDACREAKRYYAILVKEYGKENVIVRGITDDMGTIYQADVRTMPQDELIMLFDAVNNQIRYGNLNGGQPFDEMHIFCHGQQGVGIVFERAVEGVPFNKDAPGLNPVTDEGSFSPVPVKEDGKVVVAGCYTAGGDFCGWLNKYVAHVHGTNGILFTPATNTSGYIRPSWDSTPVLRGIRDFLRE